MVRLILVWTFLNNYDVIRVERKTAEHRVINSTIQKTARIWKKSTNVDYSVVSLLQVAVALMIASNSITLPIFYRNSSFKFWRFAMPNFFCKIVAKIWLMSKLAQFWYEKPTPGLVASNNLLRRSWDLQMGKMADGFCFLTQLWMLELTKG